MKKLLLFILLLPMAVLAETQNLTVSSGDHRVVLLELYTSEGCSSCPPADRFLSDIKKSGAYKNDLIPLAFHVTYWDYIGWQDAFGSTLFDNRQRDIAHKNSQGSIYTPQFVMSGKDFRRFKTFSQDIEKISRQKSTVDLTLTVDDRKKSELGLTLDTDISRSEVKDVRFFIAVAEDGLFSDVTDGENEGERLRHDYVVRKLYGPYFQSMPEANLSQMAKVQVEKSWKRDNLAIVAFAQNPYTGEILQAVKLAL